MHRLFRLSAAGTLLASALLTNFFVQAQDTAGYPARPVKIIVPFAPAGPTDVMARLIAQKLGESLGKQFYVENHPGAGGNLGMALVANAAPDGYTLLMVSSSVVVNPSLYEKVPYDVYKSLAPVTLAGSSPNILVVHPSVPARNVKELVAYIQTNPGKVSFASPGFGTTASLAAESFKYALKLDIQPVPFNGAGPALNAVVAGQVQIGFMALPGRPASAGRHAARSRDNNGKTRGNGAGCADNGGSRRAGRPDLRRDAGRVCAGEHAETDHRPAAERNCQGGRLARRQGQARFARLRRDR